MEPVKATLTKHRIGAILERIKSGEPVEPASAGWTLIDCLTVAGVLLASAMTASAGSRPKSPHSRQGMNQMLHDLQSTIEFIGAMTTAHSSGAWDEFFEPTVTIGIRADGGVTPLSGFKR